MFNLMTILSAKATALLVIVAVVMMWLSYYFYRLKQKKLTILGTYHAPYMAYSVCIIGWLICNAYFYTSLLPELGAAAGVLMAKLANLASFFAFAFAYYFSCQLAAEQRKGKIHQWQRCVLILLTVYSLFVNVRSDLAVVYVDIRGAGEFFIEFGPHTAYFFIGLVSLVVLTLVNFVTMRTSNSKLTLAKTNYMIAGILVFMLSTTAIHLGMTYFMEDFSLTWLPPVLSISEMFLVGYALLTSRFYSVKYMAYLCLSALFACTLFVLPLGGIFFPLTDSNQWIIAMPICTLIGTTWHFTYKKVSRYASLLIYGKSQTPVQQILALEENFKLSIDDGIRHLGVLLHIPRDKLRLVTSHYSESFYKDYLSSNQSVLVFDELSDEFEYKLSSKCSMRALHEKMSSNSTALVMPLFDYGRSVTHLLISPHKHNNQMFSNEEISALQVLLTRVQCIVEADRRIRQSRALANSIAHEMRNPLAQVQLQFETLRLHVEKQTVGEQIKLDIENGLAAIQRGQQLIDIILREVSDTTSEHEPSSMTSIHKAVDQAISHYGFENEQIIERIRLPQHTDFVVKLNETLFNFVIFNLIRNAIYYFDLYPDSQIEISTKIGFYENVLVFRDTGPGIDEAIVHKIFDDFFSYQKAGGSGLGLGYCQRVMCAFGGRIECESKLGEFTEFHLYFPVVPSAPKPETLRTPDFNAWKQNQRSVEPTLTPLRRIDNQVPTVLIVDDKEVQRKLVQMYLNQVGVNSLQASNGENAVEIFTANQVDLILMDVQMPVMNGFEASQKIKTLSPQTPIIALSGETGERELGIINTLMDDRLEKPTTLHALRHVLKRWSILSDEPTR